MCIYNICYIYIYIYPKLLYKVLATAVIEMDNYRSWH